MYLTVAAVIYLFNCKCKSWMEFVISKSAHICRISAGDESFLIWWIQNNVYFFDKIYALFAPNPIFSCWKTFSITKKKNARIWFVSSSKLVWHLWSLSDDCVALAVFDECVSEETKSNMASVAESIEKQILRWCTKIYLYKWLFIKFS